ncbi:hypothetical protein [Peredibacter starrii]|uniref:Uncharacterized protein n=1 Tax=Peredibacter starrii TaxID=28202 RepID=A0AAX4HKX2_9BACT|nr:hypothetical protein [Peredibacter starrii]WPU63639.1 hypothetical protein SOO65_13165 [Peredibacter starrii]
MKFLFLLVLSFSAMAQVSQKDCAPTDIRNTNPNIRDSKEMQAHFSTPRNQDSIGWCYGFTGADLMSAEMKTPISSLHTSLIYGQYKEMGLLDYLKEVVDPTPSPLKKQTSGNFKFIKEGGFVDIAILALKQRGKVCTEKALPFDQHLGRTTMSLIRKMEEIKLSVINKKLQEKIICEEISRVLPDYGLNSVDFEMVSHSLMKDRVDKTMDLMVRQYCKDNMVRVPARTVNTLYPKTAAPKTFFDTLNQTLNRGRPLAYYYDVKHVASFSGNHTSLITARRWNKGKCEYKVRNTWGKTCAYYQKGIDCNREEGSFWMSDEKLKNSSYLVQYLTE